MKKHILISAALLFSLSAATPAFAGAWMTGENENTGRWWYDNGDGTRAHSEWRWIDGDGNGIAECYCFDENGWLFVNTTTPDSYTVDINGAWIVNGIVQTQSTASTPASDQAMQSSGWQQFGTDWKYYTGGHYLTSQWRKINGKRYYFDENGIMATGFQEIDGDEYYFTSSGALKTKDFTLDGVRYIVEDDGVITDEYDSDDENWEDYQSSSSTSSSGSSKSSSSKPFSSNSDDSATSSSGGGPSSEATGSTDDSYKKPEYTSYPKESPDSSYRQSSVKDSDISEDE
ncbi:MAG: hypothetical protein MR562_00435 [Clostridiaceae bacterium]|nr:hypothetical protein [Clostridiaceae bacterium]